MNVTQAPASADPVPRGDSQRPPGRIWRRSRIPIAVLVFLAVCGVLIVALLPSIPANSYLDPANTGSAGSHALADILQTRGFQVTSVRSAGAAVAAVGPARNETVPVTLLVTSPSLLTARQLAQIARSRADLVLIAPRRPALAALAPEVSAAPKSAKPGELLRPECTLTAARLAGTANAGGYAFVAPTNASACYFSNGYPALVRYSSAGTTVTVLGSGASFTNGLLAKNGNAALALNLLSAHRRIVWLIPQPPPARTAVPHGLGPRAGQQLIPWAAWLVLFQLGIAVMLTALWRARRFGRLITERLPAVVRASETTEGHARLYQSNRARRQAADALREAARERITALIGLPGDVSAQALAEAVAARSQLSAGRIANILAGSAPGNNAELVRLARSLDELEKEVRRQ